MFTRKAGKQGAGKQRGEHGKAGSQTGWLLSVHPQNSTLNVEKNPVAKMQVASMVSTEKRSYQNPVNRLVNRENAG